MKKEIAAIAEEPEPLFHSSRWQRQGDFQISSHQVCVNSTLRGFTAFHNVIKSDCIIYNMQSFLFHVT